MEENMKNITVEGLSELLKWLQASRDFAVEQGPQVVSEILLFGRMWETSLVLMYGLMMFMSLRTTQGLFKASDKEDLTEGQKVTMVIFSFFAFIISLMFFKALTSHLKIAVMSWIAPRLYVIDYLKGMVDGS